MICSLCKVEKKTKKNTHYLTDSIIRTALNEGGVNVRDKGLYFEIDPDNLFSSMKFQRATSPEKIEEMLGRESNEEEIIESINKIAYSVDDKFCKECEDIFGVIEVNFNEEILKYFREQEFSEDNKQIEFNIEESKILRLFFLMQFWRTSICEEGFSLPEDISEQLRLKILNIDYNDLEKFHLSVTYLQTLPEEEDKEGDDSYKTSNFIIITEGSNPYIIVMNDFVIQLYDMNSDLPFIKFYDLNNEENYKSLLNFNQAKFTSLVFLNSQRKEFLYKMAESVAHLKIKDSLIFFKKNYELKFGNVPDIKLAQKYLDELSKYESINRFSGDNMTRFTTSFLDNCERT